MGFARVASTGRLHAIDDIILIGLADTAIEIERHRAAGVLRGAGA